MSKIFIFNWLRLFYSRNTHFSNTYRMILHNLRFVYHMRNWDMHPKNAYYRMCIWEMSNLSIVSRLYRKWERNDFEMIFFQNLGKLRSRPSRLRPLTYYIQKYLSSPSLQLYVIQFSFLFPIIKFQIWSRFFDPFFDGNIHIPTGSDINNEVMEKGEGGVGIILMYSDMVEDAWWWWKEETNGATILIH